MCEHGRERNRCKECGGVYICEHGRRRSDCKECRRPRIRISEVERSFVHFDEVRVTQWPTVHLKMAMPSSVHQVGDQSGGASTWGVGGSPIIRGGLFEIRPPTLPSFSSGAYCKPTAPVASMHRSELTYPDVGTYIDLATDMYKSSMWMKPTEMLANVAFALEASKDAWPSAQFDCIHYKALQLPISNSPLSQACGPTSPGLGST